jgi:hypothetical protein
MRLHLEILPQSLRRLWPELGLVPEDFVLYGGAAIALHLGHRPSADFNFFAARDFEPRILQTMLPFLAHAELVQSGRNSLTCSVDRGGPVLVSFLGTPRFECLEKPVQAADNGVRIASLLDLAGTKAALITQRAEVKDYIDLAALIAGGYVDLESAFNAAYAIYGDQFSPAATLKALAHCEEDNVASLPEAARRTLIEAVRAVDAAKLGSLSLH